MVALDYKARERLAQQKSKAIVEEAKAERLRRAVAFSESNLEFGMYSVARRFRVSEKRLREALQAKRASRV